MTTLKVFVLVLSLIGFGVSCFALGYSICITSTNKRVQKLNEYIQRMGSNNNELQKNNKNLLFHIRILTLYGQELEKRAGLGREELEDLYIQSINKSISENEQLGNREK